MDYRGTESSIDTAGKLEMKFLGEIYEKLPIGQGPLAYELPSTVRGRGNNDNNSLCVNDGLSSWLYSLLMLPAFSLSATSPEDQRCNSYVMDTYEVVRPEPIPFWPMTRSDIDYALWNEVHVEHFWQDSFIVHRVIGTHSKEFSDTPRTRVRMAIFIMDTILYELLAEKVFSKKSSLVDKSKTGWLVPSRYITSRELCLLHGLIPQVKAYSDILIELQRLHLTSEQVYGCLGESLDFPIANQLSLAADIARAGMQSRQFNKLLRRRMFVCPWNRELGRMNREVIYGALPYKLALAFLYAV